MSAFARRATVPMLGLCLALSGCSDNEDTDYPNKEAGTGDAGDGGGKVLDRSTGLPDGYKFWSCKTPGAPCNAHDPCAINPICGKDNKCRPQSLMSCDDGLDCTVDRCLGMGVCENKPKPGTCALAYRVYNKPDGGTSPAKDAGTREAGAADGGPDLGIPTTIVKCFKDGDRNPEDPCMICNHPAGDGGTTTPEPKRWSPATGGACDDSNPCTKNDYCQGGSCQGTYYGNQCADAYGCTTDYCDGKGGCLGSKLKSDWCLISGTCYKDGQKDPSGSCFKCSVSNSQSSWTAITNSCQINGKCYDKNDRHPYKCAICDPSTSATSWTVDGSYCLINDQCKNPGDLDAIGCAQCDPKSDKYGWTQLAGVCKIFGQCYVKSAKHVSGCAVCDPSTSTSSWTVSGNYCLINNICYMPGDKDPIQCAQCDPTKDKYGWTPISGLCKIGGQCHKDGDQHPGKCAKCDTATSQTSWTVTTNACLIYNTCHNPGDKDLSGCASCDPTTNKYDWTTLSGTCKIDGKCYKSGDKHVSGCATCDPSKSTTTWTASSGCVIDGACFNTGAKHSTGCGTCDPTKSTTQWTVTGKSCIVGDKCFSQGTKEAGGCGTCDPTKSTAGWTMGTGCGATHVWSKSFGSTSSDYPYSIAVDGNGNIYVSGYFYGTVNFGGVTLTASGTDIYLASYTPSGNLRWAKKFGSTSSDYGYGVAVDNNGNVYMTGYFYGSVSFGGSTLTSNGSGDAFLASFTSDGTHRWSTSFGSTSSDYGYDVATDSSGNVYVTGYFYYSMTVGTTSHTSKGSYDGYLASFTSDGKYRWSKSWGNTSSDYGYGVATDSSDNVYVTGYFYNSVDFGGGTLMSKGSGDIYLASFNSSGAHRWSSGFGGTSSDYGYGVATDASDNVYLTGYVYGTVNFGGGTLTTSSGDAYLASFSSAGSHRWSKVFGGTSSDYGYDVATDTGGGVYITGYFYNTIKFGGLSHTSAGSYDVFVAGFTQSGSYKWSRHHGSTSSDYGRAVATDGDGNVIFGANYYYNVDFGGGTFTNAGSYDVAVVKLKQK